MDETEKIVLRPDEMLVKKLEDYYKASNDFTDANSVQHAVGVIEHIGKNVDDTFLGKIIYYHLGIATEVNLKGIGLFDVVTENIMLLVRLDQTKNNY